MKYKVELEKISLNEAVKLMNNNKTVFYTYEIGKPTWLLDRDSLPASIVGEAIYLTPTSFIEESPKSETHDDAKRIIKSMARMGEKQTALDNVSVVNGKSIVKVITPYEGCPSGRILSSITVHDNGSVTGYNYYNEDDWTRYTIQQGDYVFVNEDELFETELGEPDYKVKCSCGKEWNSKKEAELDGYKEAMDEMGIVVANTCDYC